MILRKAFILGLFSRKKKTSVDFATVDSPDKAESLVKQGVLARVLLVPPQRGGLEDPLNAVYATPEAAKEKARCDAEVEKLERSGRVSRYACDLEYDQDGPSRVARAITVVGKDEAGDVVYSRTAKVW